jgi:hypothetical protein
VTLNLLTASIALPDTFADGLLGFGTGFQFASVIDLSAVGTDRTIGPADRFVQLAGAFFVADPISDGGELETIETHKGFSPLDCCGEKPENLLEVRTSGLTPEFRIAPTPAETEAGAHYVRVRPLGRWYNRNFHGWTVGSEADCDDDLHCFAPFYAQCSQHCADCI